MRRSLALALLGLSALLVALASNVALAATLPTNQAQYVQQVIQLVSVQRQQAGLSPLTSNAALTQAAQDYSVVLADSGCFSHSCGSDLTGRLDQVGYTGRTAWGENIASGYPTPDAVMTAWMNSSGHRANILNADYRDIGVGIVANAAGQLLWVQDFGKSRTATGTLPTPTPVPSPSVACSPRPTFSVHTSPSTSGILAVTVAAGTSGGAANNTLKAVRVGSVANGTVEISGRGPVASGTTVTMPAGTQQATLLVHRTASGAATTAPLVLTDACGDWPTLVGGGPSAF